MLVGRRDSLLLHLFLYKRECCIGYRGPLQEKEEEEGEEEEEVLLTAYNK